MRTTQWRRGGKTGTIEDIRAWLIRGIVVCAGGGLVSQYARVPTVNWRRRRVPRGGPVAAIECRPLKNE